MHSHYYTAVYKLIKRLSACKFVSSSERYRTRSERKFGSKRTERSEHSLEPWVQRLMRIAAPMEGHNRGIINN